MVTEEKQLWDWSRSDGGHYSRPVPALRDTGMLALRVMFPDGIANEMNFVLFSTSGVHGSYRTIEEHESDPLDEGGDRLQITFVVVQPRIVAMRYGNVCPESPDDYAFLKKLRETSWAAAQEIGK